MCVYVCAFFLSFLCFILHLNFVMAVHIFFDLKHCFVSVSTELLTLNKFSTS